MLGISIDLWLRRPGIDVNVWLWIQMSTPRLKQDLYQSLTTPIPGKFKKPSLGAMH